MSYFIDKNQFNYLGILNTKIYSDFTKIINPTINFSNGVFALLPALFTQNEKFNKYLEYL